MERFFTTLDEPPKLLAEKPRFADFKECFETLTDDDPIIQELYSKYLYNLRKEYAMKVMGKRASFGWFTILTSCEFSI